MLILEVTNPQDQLNLLKKIIDSTRSAIAAEAAAKPRVHRAVKPIAKSLVKPTATKAVKPTQTTGAEKTAAAIVQRDATQTQHQVLQPDPRRVYPSTTAKPKPIARLGKVNPVNSM